MTTPETWAGERVARWLRQAPGLERQLAPVSEQLFGAAAIRPGEHVLDVGCGTGPTTRQAAELAGPSGRVSGLDISPDMLAAAAAVAASGAPVEWIEADVTTWVPRATYDLVLSRFGVMFFADPPAAVAALAAATRPGGRLAVAVWGRRGESPLFEVPYRTALAVRAACDDPAEPLPEDQGPFSWSDRATVAPLLEAAGWSQVELAEQRLRLPFAGGVGPDEAATAAIDFGPTRTILQDARPETAAAALPALRDAFADQVDEHGHVVLDAVVQIVTARR